MSGREGIVLRLTDDDVSILTTYFVWTWSLGDVLQKQIYQNQGYTQCDQDAECSLAIDICKEESTGGDKPDDAEISAHRQEMHHFIDGISAKVVIDPIKDFQFAFGY